MTPWTVAHQTSLSMGFSRQEYWSGLLCPPPGDLPNPGIKPRSSALQADSLPSEPLGKPKITGVAYPFCSGSSQSRNWTRVSCIPGGFFTSWAIREALSLEKTPFNKKRGRRKLEENLISNLERTNLERYPRTTLPLSHKELMNNTH